MTTIGNRQSSRFPFELLSLCWKWTTHQKVLAISSNSLLGQGPRKPSQLWKCRFHQQRVPLCRVVDAQYLICRGEETGSGCSRKQMDVRKFRLYSVKSSTKSFVGRKCPRVIHRYGRGGHREAEKNWGTFRILLLSDEDQHRTSWDPSGRAARLDYFSIYCRFTKKTL